MLSQAQLRRLPNRLRLLRPLTPHRGGGSLHAAEAQLSGPERIGRLTDYPSQFALREQIPVLVNSGHFLTESSGYSVRADEHPHLPRIVERAALDADRRLAEGNSAIID